MSLTTSKNKGLLFLAFASVYIIWGATFLAVSFALRGFPPFFLSGFRFLAAGLILFLWRLYRGERKLSFGNWKKNGITGMLILTGGTGLVAWGEQYITATEAAIAIATGPFWFIVIDKKNWRRYFSNPATVAGLVIGFAGLLLFFKDSISSSTGIADNHLRILAFAVLALSSISWVLGSLYSRHHRADHSTFMNIAQQLLIAGVAALIIGLAKGELAGFVPSAIPLKAWTGLAFLVLFGSIVAYLSYIWLLSVKPLVLVSTHTYINPIVAVLLGWLFIHEHISSLRLLGLAIILGGVLLTNASGYKLPRRTAIKFRRIVKKRSRTTPENAYLVDF